jgi:hypothetical protein
MIELLESIDGRLAGIEEAAKRNESESAGG